MDAKIIPLPKISDPRGNLSIIEQIKQIPFEIKRVHWIYDVPGGADRGGHAYKETQYDKLAETVREALDMDLIYRILEEGV